MKNLLKFGFFALAVSLSFAACTNSNKATENAADSVDSISTAVVDSIKTDADAKIDTIDSVSSAVIDSLKK